MRDNHTQSSRSARVRCSRRERDRLQDVELVR
jgi:hypothetical protein